MFPTLSNFCCGLSTLQEGTKMAGRIFLVFTMHNFLQLWKYCSAINSDYQALPDLEKIVTQTQWTTYLVLCWIFNIISFILTMILFHGVGDTKIRILKCWVSYHIGYLILQVYATVFILHLVRYLEDANNPTGLSIISTTLVLINFISGYLIWVVYSYLQELLDERRGAKMESKDESKSKILIQKGFI